MEFIEAMTAAYYAGFNSGVYLMPMIRDSLANFVESFSIVRGWM